MGKVTLEGRNSVDLLAGDMKGEKRTGGGNLND